jgi:hypothetical protein
MADGKGLNPGQKRLIQDYAIPWADEYYNSDPTGLNDDRFFNGLYSKHPAIEGAIAPYVEQVYSGATAVYAAGMFAQADAAVKQEAADIAAEEEALQEEMDALQEEQDEMKQEFENWNANEFRGMKPKMWEAFELTGRQFIGADALPFWHVEFSRLVDESTQYVVHGGVYNHSAYMSALNNLLDATRSNPNTTSAPPGYHAQLPYG